MIANNESEPTAQVNRSLRLYVTALLVLTAVAYAVVGFRGHVLHEPSPWNSLVDFPGLHRFEDFTFMTLRLAHLGERDMLTRADIPSFYPYPLPSIYLFLFFMRFFPDSLVAYLVFVCILFGSAASLLSYAIMRVTKERLPFAVVWLTLLTSFPLLYLIYRANIEGALWLLLLLGLVAFAHDRPMLAAVFWGLAASMKVLPALLLLLLLARRKYWAFAAAIGLAMAMVLLSAIHVGPTFRQALADSSRSATTLKAVFMIHIIAPQFDDSALGAVKQVVSVWRRLTHTTADLTDQLRTVLSVYTYVAAAATCALYWFRLRRMPILNQLIALLALYVLLPQASYEYRLVQMYLGWGAFLLFLVKDVSSGRAVIPVWVQNACLLSFAILFTPQVYLRVGHSFPIGGFVKCCTLLALFAMVLVFRMPSSVFGELPAPLSSTAYGIGRRDLSEPERSVSATIVDSSPAHSW